MGEFLGMFIIGFIVAAVMIVWALEDWVEIEKDDTGKLWCSYKGSVYTLHLVDLEKEEPK